MEVVLGRSVNYQTALVRIKALRETGNKPSSDQVTTKFTDTATMPQSNDVFFHMLSFC